MKINQRKAGVILSYAGQLTKILISIIYTPIMLRLLGQSEYGLYQLVYSVVSYLSLLSLGFSSSYMRFYSRNKAQRDEDGVARLNGMFLLIFTSLSIVCVLCGCVMLGNIKGIFGSGLTDSEYSTARILMALLVVNLALTFPNSVFSCAITAHEKFLFQKFLILLQNVCKKRGNPSGRYCKGCVRAGITASTSRTEERSCISMSELERIIHDDSNDLDYILVGEIYLPLIAVPEEKRDIGFYGSLHRNYLKDYKSGLYSYLTLTGKLWTYLADLNEQCVERRDFLMNQIMKQEGISEELKTRDQMEWIRQANNVRSRVDEIILNELVYV